MDLDIDIPDDIIESVRSSSSPTAVDIDVPDDILEAVRNEPTREQMDPRTLAVARGLIEGSPTIQAEYMRTRGFNTRVSEGKVEYQKEGKWEPLDPTGLDAGDVVAAIGPTISTLAAFLPAFGLAGIAVSGAAGAAVEGMKQGLAVHEGVPGAKMDYGQIAATGAISAAGTGLLKALSGGWKVAKAYSKLGAGDRKIITNALIDMLPGGTSIRKVKRILRDTDKISRTASRASKEVVTESVGAAAGETTTGTVEKEVRQLLSPKAIERISTKAAEDAGQLRAGKVTEALRQHAEHRAEKLSQTAVDKVVKAAEKRIEKQGIRAGQQESVRAALEKKIEEAGIRQKAAEKAAAKVQKRIERRKRSDRRKFDEDTESLEAMLRGER